MSCAKGATVIKLSAAAVAVVCASSALFWLISPVRVLSAEANSGAPWEEGVTADGIYSVHEDSVLEVQSEVLTFDISSLPSDIVEGKSYDARVTAEYTFYNPTDEYVTTAMAFPFGIRPYYAEELDVAQISDPIKIDGKTADYQIRHTYGKYGEFERDVHGILPDYIEDDFYSPELPVTVYTVSVKYDNQYNANYNPDLRLDSLSLPADRTRIVCPGLRGEGEDLYYWWPVAEQDTVTIYVLGEDFAVGELDWYVSYGMREYGNAVIPSDIEFSSKKSTLGDIIFSEYDEAYGINRIDWYNAVVGQLADDVNAGDSLTADEYNFNAWYVYETTVAPRSSFTNSVTAPLFPTIHFNYEPRIYEFIYYLSPAAGWADFGEMTIVVNTPYYIQGSFSSDNVTFESAQGGYFASSDGLPEGELAFALCPVETPERVSYYGGGKNMPYVLVYVAIIILPILGLVLLAVAAGLVIRFNRKKKVKGSLNSDNIGNDDVAK